MSVCNVILSFQEVQSILYLFQMQHKLILFRTIVDDKHNWCIMDLQDCDMTPNTLFYSNEKVGHIHFPYALINQLQSLTALPTKEELEKLIQPDKLDTLLFFVEI